MIELWVMLHHFS